jgi:hypothetical protein
MKAICLVLLTFLSAGAAAAQEAAAREPHGVSVVKMRWEKRLPEQPPVYDIQTGETDRARLEREQKEAARANAVLRQVGRDPIPPPTEPRYGRRDAPPSELASNKPYYLYEAKLSNNGTKKIRSVIWEYVLFEPETQRVVGNHPFETKVGIGVGQTKSVSAWSSRPPASVVDVSKSDKEKRGQYSERVIIHRIVYEDGTVWERERN